MGGTRLTCRLLPPPLLDAPRLQGDTTCRLLPHTFLPHHTRLLPPPPSTRTHTLPARGRIVRSLSWISYHLSLARLIAVTYSGSLLCNICSSLSGIYLLQTHPHLPLLPRCLTTTTARLALTFYLPFVTYRRGGQAAWWRCCAGGRVKTYFCEPGLWDTTVCSPGVILLCAAFANKSGLCRISTAVALLCRRTVLHTLSCLAPIPLITHPILRRCILLAFPHRA